jgi:hypothetical protein
MPVPSLLHYLDSTLCFYKQEITHLFTMMQVWLSNETEVVGNYLALFSVITIVQKSFQLPLCMTCSLKEWQGFMKP